MRRLFYIVLFLCLLVPPAWGLILITGKPTALTCQEYLPTPATITEDSAYDGFISANRAYVGLRWTADANVSVCQVDWWQEAVANDSGGPALYDFYVQIWTLSDPDLNVEQGESTKVDGTNDANTYYQHTFSSPVALTNTVEYAFTVKMCTDGAGASCAPTSDNNDYPTLGYDVNAGAPIWGEKNAWVDDKTEFHSDGNDDFKFKIYTMQ